MTLQTSQEMKIALCLSGGGFRATLFHVGVVKALRDCGLLEAVTDIYSVSGGSILAAHLAQNWFRYNGEWEEFVGAVTDLRRITRRDIRGRLLRRWILWWPVFGGPGRTVLLQREYEHFFGTRPISEIYSRQDGEKIPLIHLLATNFNTGELCQFSSGLYTEGGDEHHCHAPLSFAIAASSAFPPLFPPAKLVDSFFGQVTSDKLQGRLHLTDGGVFDNLGFYQVDKTTGDVRFNSAIVSDACGVFRSEKRGYWNVVSRTIRSTNILMKRLGQEALSSIQSHKIRPMHVAINSTVKSDFPQGLQQELQGVRTDLNVFTEVEARLLVEHGERIGRAELAKRGIFPSESARPLYESKLRLTEQQIDKVLTRARSQSLLRSAVNLFRNYRDPALYALVAVTVSVVFLGWSGYKLWERRTGDNAAELNSSQPEKRTNELESRLLNLERTLARSGANVGPVPAPTPAPMLRDEYQIWVHFAGRIVRQEMIDFARGLATKGWRVPAKDTGGERTQRAAGMAKIRYPPGQKQAAELLKKDLQEFWPSEFLLEAEELLPSGFLEIWLSR